MRPRTQKVGWQLSGFPGGFQVRISAPVKHQPLQPATGLCILIVTGIELERLEKPLRKLRKSLKEWPSDPPVMAAPGFLLQEDEWRSIH
jgi:hypothetical protein